MHHAFALSKKSLDLSVGRGGAVSLLLENDCRGDKQQNAMFWLEHVTVKV